MKVRKHDFALGLTAIVIFAIFMGTVLFLHPFSERKTYRIVVQFRHSEGLAPGRPGSPVLLSGAVEVGKIVKVFPEEIYTASPDGKKQKELVIIVEAELDALIELHEDCQITTDQPAVGGVATLVILDVGTKAMPLLEQRRIQGLPPQSLAATIGTLSRRLLGPNGFVDKLDRLIDANVEGSMVQRILRSLTDINDITDGLWRQLSATEEESLMARLLAVIDDVDGITSALRQEVGGTQPANLIAKVRLVLDRLAEGLNEMAEMLHENRAPVARTIANVESLTQKLDEQMVATIMAELNRDDPDSMLGKVHVSMDRVNQSLSDVQTVTSTAREVTVLSRPAMQRTVGNLKEMSEQLRLAGEEIRLAPWRLMYQPTAREKQQMSVFEAARTFAEAATYLDDASARLEAALAAAPPDGRPTVESDAELKEIRESVRRAFERFKLAEDFLWEKMK